MKAQDLKKSILQLAIQGKLVEQDPNDEPASALLEKIKAEKAALVKAGKIKKDKQESHIFKGDDNKYYEQIGTETKDITDEIPFDIPNNWEWARLGNLFNVILGQSPDGNSVNGTNGVEFHQGKVYFDDKYLNASNQYTTKPSKLVQKDTVLLCVRAPVGIVNITPRDICIGRGLAGISNLAGMATDFTYYLLQAFKKEFISKATGTTFVAITGDVIQSQLLPLPPLAEQKRIVAKIEELEPLIAEYDTAETALTALNTAFPEQMKKSILQQAIQGKLVKQDPNDEPATVLLERIKAEKAALVKAGKIKKDKPLPPITDDEIPFDIPDSWTWVRLGDISNYSSPKKKISPNQITSEMWSLDLEDIEKGTGRIIEKHFAKDRAIQGEKVCFEKGNILYSKLRPYLLKILIADDNGITSPELIPFNIYGDSYQPFFLWYLRSPYVDSIVNSASYGVKMPRVGTETMIQLLVPLPPLAEQKRIVAKIDELLKICEEI